MDSDIEIIAISDAAKLCKVTRATVWRWIKTGLLPAGVTAGGNYRIYREDLENLIKTKKMVRSSRISINKHKILVVDDDQGVQKTLGQLLKRNGYDVDFASDGFEAGLKTMKFNPILIILDLFMPKMDGFEVCQHLKEHPDTATIKIIAISGYESKENKQRILEYGADRFFTKPLDTKMLINEINTMLR